MHDDLASCLRAWRDRLDPAEAGLPRAALRRAPGLRREEVAAQAGVSVNYLTRLEQGRARHPSASVVAALARALRLDAGEAEHLHRLAGHAAPVGRVAARHLTPSVQRILDRLGDVPVLVTDAAWTLVAANPLALALLGVDEGAVGANVARNHFTDVPSRVERTEDGRVAFERELVSGLNVELARHPDDRGVRELIDELHDASPRFRELWAERPTTTPVACRKSFRHPEAGLITLDCDFLRVEGTDLRILVYTATPGSSDASALALLSVVGLESFSA